MTLGLTACGNYRYYHEWFVNEPGVNIVTLGYDADNFHEIGSCDAIVLTGGQDIHPRYYSKTMAEIPNATAIDEARDEFEWRVLEYIYEKEMPLLGICRGLQITNVFFGGTLIEDIPSAGKAEHSKFSEGVDRYHPVTVAGDSRLRQVLGVPGGEINSAHHQGVAIPGRGLRAVAFSDDGIIEALERIAPGSNPYLLLVQWHPERMKDPASPFSDKIKADFLAAVHQAH